MRGRKKQKCPHCGSKIVMVDFRIDNALRKKELLMESKKVKNAEELGKAIKEDAIYIEITDDEFGKKIIRIKAIGKISWGLVIGATTVALTAIIVPITAPIAVPTATMMAAPAIASGIAVLIPTATAIAVTAGGVGALNKLRKYKLRKKDGKVFLQK